MISLDRVHSSGARRVGAVVAALALATAVSPVTAYAQDATDPSSAGSGDSGSVEDLVGVIPEEIVVGGPAVGGSEGLRAVGSGAVPEAAQSAGEVIGSTAPLEAVGSAGGSAAASVASSGSLPGSVYANPTGSIGSGTIGLGSLAVPEYVLPVLSVQFAGGYFTAMGERQAAAELYPHELTFWHDVVIGSAEAGATLEDAADAAGTELPGGMAGSIDAVQVSALEDPFEEQEKLKAELEAEAAAEEAGEDADEGAGDDSERYGGTTEDSAMTVDDDEVAAGGRDAIADAPVPADTTPAEKAIAAPAAATAADVTDGSPATLANTGVQTTAVAGIAAVSLLLGGLLLAASRRRA